MQKLVESYERLWNESADPPDIEEFLSNAQIDLDAVPAKSLLPVILLDQKKRWSAGKPIKVEQYVAKLPFLKDDAAGKAELLLGELIAHGNEVSPEEVDQFASRFPDASEEFKSKLQDYLESKESDASSPTLPKSQQELTATKSIFQDERDGARYFGRYRLSRVLGEGAFGKVYLAVDTELKRHVAIKVPRDDRFHSDYASDKYLDEARTVASLDHPHIVPVYDTGRDQEFIYVVSKFIDGFTFREWMDSDASLQEKVKLLVPVAKALAFAHQKQLIHRDVKPGNLLLEEATMTPYVADFGLAIREQDYLQEGIVAGTPAYMAPEQIKGEAHRLDGRSDLYSLGVILYEMLAGQKPFQGNSPTDLLEKVLHSRLIPPSEFKANVPLELERICLKALSRRMADRHSDADEFADDLNRWIHSSQKTAITDAPVIPKGICAFEAEDQTFFTQLLPGPRDQNGLPESIRFWKNRLEGTEVETQLQVGLIYGPSGSGKSSFVKAGLLPILDESTDVVFVEATGADTESTLRQKLARRQDSPDQSLVETCKTLRAHANKKTLIIIDQFEQWLHANSSLDSAELVQALRQCDGQNLQAILLVRDDFWLAVSRFMKAIEIDLVQGQNIGLVDLFDKEHARFVLSRFGQAFGKLPAASKDLTKEQIQFLDQAISTVATDNRVVGVQLALMAEMIKNRPWSAESLKLIQEAGGIGERFLEHTFVDASANPAHRIHGDAVRKILRLLLPDRASNLKGSQKPESELLAASGYQGRDSDFREVIQILVNETRIVTPVDSLNKTIRPGETDGGDQAESELKSDRCYQLTHDFMVNAIRNWLEKGLRETSVGRAWLKLSEHSDYWASHSTNQFLPSPSDWLKIRLLTKSSQWNQQQSTMMKSADRFYFSRAVLSLLVLIVVGVSSFEIRRRVIDGRKNAEAGRMVQGLLQADTSTVPDFIREQLVEFENWTGDDLDAAYSESESESKAKLHAALAMANDSPEAVEFLKIRIFQSNAVEFLAIREVLQPQNQDWIPQLWLEIDNQNQSSLRRFYAAALAADYDRKNPKWQDASLQQFLAKQLVEMRPSELSSWRDALSPIREKIDRHLFEIYRDSPDTQFQSAAMDALLTYRRDSPEALFEMLCHANERQLPIVLQQLSPYRDETIEACKSQVTEQIEARRSEPPMAPSASQDVQQIYVAANCATALMLLDHEHLVWQFFGYPVDPTFTTQTLHLYRQMNGDPKRLVNHYSDGNNANKYALLLCLGDYDPKQLDPGVRQKFLVKIANDFERNDDSGIHGAARWLLSRWKKEDELKTIENRVKETDAQVPTPKEKRNWYISSSGQSFSVLNIDDFRMGSPDWEELRSPIERSHIRKVNRRIAVATTEVTRAQWRPFALDVKINFRADQRQLIPFSPTDNCPMLGITWYEAAWYCNWLSKQEDIPDDQWCYKPNAEGKYGPGMQQKDDFAEKTGYRLLTEGEWEYMCRGGSDAATSFGSNLKMIPQFSWYHENANRKSYPVATKKPNRYGIFDGLGNAFEWCNDRFLEYKVKDGAIQDVPMFGAVADFQACVQRGGSFLELKSNMRSAARNENPPNDRGLATGFRIARTLPK